ncbi:glycoside hydrolase family 3 protein [Bacillus sp. V2I10]|uniref:beta-glucosidase n=1 Tax=Bacillus sp. V2I10 TaxID=3042276 RepID=UPI00277E5E57|nr:glycoside hydrolase family 3 C-terminal domain-containing protein [Bacillus sp. V2I10]MDQ0859994.1 beta-glucosidase [Bacillus sp. V2I10]
MNRDIKTIVSQMTLEEKAGMCSGFDYWHTKAVERLGIPSIMLSDGPHGLRKQENAADHLGLNRSIPATCFPPAVNTASSWDRKLIERVGNALGVECQAEGIAILLGPGTNLKRSPLGGRNFEYFSEDPYFSTEMAANYIKGIQSQGVGASLKHFAANNQEHNRFLIDVEVDERTLRELYLASFEGAVKQSQPWTVMCAYNKLNGYYCSENKYLLSDILKEEWGYDGIVVSDWGAVNERAEGLAAGMELEMPPGILEGDKKIIAAVNNGTLSEDLLDKAVERLLKVIFKAADSKKEKVVRDMEAHHNLARDIARESMVLLKNENNILPLRKEGTLAVIGAFAENPRYQGGGSSYIIPTRIDIPLKEIEKLAGPEMKVVYAEGYRKDNLTGRYSKHPLKSSSDQPDMELIEEARKAAEKADVAIVFAGLPETYESEGTDRKHIGIPEGQRKLIEAVAEVQKNTVVVLSNGSPIEMPWLDSVKGVLEAYLGGQATGGAIADILFGIANPCGKLAETFPKKLSDNPSFLNFPGDEGRVEYREGLFIGYRYYDAMEIEPLFPFGFGLSYTSFEYTWISVDKKEMYDNDLVTVRVKVKNTGTITGKEIVQLYVKDVESSVIRPYKELKGFEKVELSPGEEKTIEFTLEKRAFAYYNTDIKDWYVESGEFEILVGKSSKEISLKETIRVKSTTVIKKRFTRNSTLLDCMSDPIQAEIIKPLLESIVEKFGLQGNSERQTNFLKGMPLRLLISFQPIPFTEADLDYLLQKLNE